jgi:hypothetical protein
MTSVNEWEPRFHKNDCIKWSNYDNICVKEVIFNKDNSGGTYVFKEGGSTWGPSLDQGTDRIPAAEKKEGGKRKTRRNRKSKKSRKGKSRKNRRKSNRRR